VNSLRTAKRFVFPLLGLWVLLYASFSLVKPPLFDGTDAVQAEAAREMAVNGGWAIPRVNGMLSPQTSPLLTWITAASFKLFGVSDWAARLPLAFCALALFGLILTLGSRMFLTPVAGFYAALILLTSFGIFLFARLLFPALLLTLWITLAMYFFWRSLRTLSWQSAAGFGAACALGFLSMGLAGVALPVGIVLLFLFYTRNLRHLARWHPAAGAGAFLLILTPWMVAAYRATANHGPYLVAARNAAKTPVLLFWAFALIWMLPWCLFALAALGRVSARLFSRSAELDHGQQGLLLLVLWAGLVVVLYTFSSRREFFMLPALPALSLLAAGWLAADEAAPSRLGMALAWVFFAAGAITAGVAAFLALRAPVPAPGTDIATLLNLNRGLLHGHFGHIRGLTFVAMGAFRAPLVIAAAALAAGVTANLVFRRRGKARLANCFLAGMMACVLIAAHLALNTFSPVVSSAVLAEAIKPEVEAGDVVVVNGRYEDASALGFYLERPVKLLNARADAMAPWSLAPDAPAIFVDDAALGKLWSSATRVFLWTSAGSVPELPGEAYVVGRDGGREIVSNQPNSGGASF
jgi:4-amino-4-deoxy-L-arabinose transferase-like glycosyltransferase